MRAWALSVRREFALIAALVLICAVAPSATAAGPVSWSAPILADHLAPFTTPGLLDGISCPTTSFCAAVDAGGAVLTSTQPTGGADAWRAAFIDDRTNTCQRGLTITTCPAGLNDVSCPSSSMCVAVDGIGDVLTSTDPSAGAGSWSIGQADTGTISCDLGTCPDSLQRISCPSATLCVAIGEQQTFVSRDPAGGAGTWRSSGPHAGYLASVSCASTTLCVVIDGSGDIFTSTDPGVASSWRETSTPGAPPTSDVSCPTASLCVIVGDSGTLITSTSPASGDWHESSIAGGDYLLRVSCGAPSTCLVADDSGNFLSSTDPTSPSAWHSAPVDSAHGPFGAPAITCTSSSFCAAVDSDGNALTSSNPTGGASGWGVHEIDGTDTITHAACPWRTLCVAADSQGRVITVRGRARRISIAEPADGPSAALSCPSISFCAGIDASGNLVTDTNPGARPTAWRKTRFPHSGGLNAVSCTPGRLCAAVDQTGRLLVSTDPTGPAAAWHRVGIRLSVTAAISCFAPSTCVILDVERHVFSSSDPTGGRRAWHERVLHPPGTPPGFSGAFYGFGIDDLSCLRRLCVGAASFGELLTSTHPTGSARAWRMGRLYPGGFVTGVSCASPALCAIGSRSGVALASSAPARGQSSWSAVQIDSSPLEGISCAPTTFCVATDDSGDLIFGATALRHAYGGPIVTRRQASRAARITLTAGVDTFPLKTISLPGRARIISVRGADGHRLAVIVKRSRGTVRIALRQAAASLTVSVAGVHVGALRVTDAKRRSYRVGS